ncbi:MarR family winged helix-turn-helix transcriptional regulator [Ruania rhizosphaerae]|uniref:MarR family winged helix-turn-helix transcriptional regulator n=1 Tax=Ruania rhizosphaerae TaxID=1840413 RepID=UPI001356EFC8|nr:MarR family transcriptional regulator [Ruania rhizosphaerae]
MVKALRTRATWLVSRAQVRAYSLLKEMFGAVGVRPYHYRILAALDESGPVSQAELGRATGSDRSDISVAIEALCSSGLTARQADPADRRRNVISLTDRGRSELHRLDAVLDEAQERFLAPLTRAEQVVFLQLIARLSDDEPQED